MPANRQTGMLARSIPDRNFVLAQRRDERCERGWGAWQVAFGYSYLDLSDGDVLGGVEENYTLALNWHWTPYARVQFNLIFGDIERHAPVAGFTEGDFVIAGTRFAADF